METSLVNQEEFMASPMGQAIAELDTEMSKRNMPPIQLNVIGGFALMLHGARDINDQTDIDYVGKSLPEEITEIANPIGVKHGLGNGWINNDVMLSGTDMESFEFTTGKLHFKPALTTDNIRINILDPEDLLRLKIISIDTASTAIEVGGDFTRAKDIPDIIKLSEMQHTTPQHAVAKYSSYLISPHTAHIIDAYEKNGAIGVEDYIDEIRKNTRATKPNRKLPSTPPSATLTEQEAIDQIMGIFFD